MASLRINRRGNSRGTGEWWLVVLLLFALIPEGLTITMSGRSPVVSIYDFALIAVMLFLLLRNVLGTFTFDLSDKTFVYLSTACLFGQLVSLLFNFRDVPRGILGVKVYFFAFLTYLVAISVIRSQMAARRVLHGLIYWGGAVGLLLAYHFVTDWSGIIGQEASYESKSEIGISMGRSNYLAALLVPIMPLAVTTLLSPSTKRRMRLAVPAALTLIGLLITMSKGAFAALLVGLL